MLTHTAKYNNKKSYNAIESSRILTRLIIVSPKTIMISVARAEVYSEISDKSDEEVIVDIKVRVFITPLYIVLRCRRVYDPLYQIGCAVTVSCSSSIKTVIVKVKASLSNIPVDKSCCTCGFLSEAAHGYRYDWNREKEDDRKAYGLDYSPRLLADISPEHEECRYHCQYTLYCAITLSACHRKEDVDKHSDEKAEYNYPALLLQTHEIEQEERDEVGQHVE